MTFTTYLLASEMTSRVNSTLNLSPWGDMVAGLETLTVLAVLSMVRASLAEVPGM